MLGNCVEKGVNKCAQYFPLKARTYMEVGQLVVTCTRQQPLGNECTLRAIEISGLPGGEVVRCSHLHYYAWPDHGRPRTTSGIRAMCHHLEALRAAGTSSSAAAADDAVTAASSAAAAAAAGAPIVVHCSAGIGRTGTFCAIDLLLQKFRCWGSRCAAG
jgi:tyrosine-protein phosphatase non-receptor type 9